MRFFGALFWGGLCLLCTFAMAQEVEQEPDKSRLGEIVDLYDLSESALAYHKHCVSQTQLPSIRFMDNSRAIAMELAGELGKKFPDKSKNDIFDEMAKRAYHLQRGHDLQYMKLGKIGRCKTEKALSAQRQYSIFLSMDLDQILEYMGVKSSSDDEALFYGDL